MPHGEPPTKKPPPSVKFVLEAGAYTLPHIYLHSLARLRPSEMLRIDQQYY